MPKNSKNSLESDILKTEWICVKIQEDDIYAQNLYAALCNNQFQKLEVIPILSEERWSCSWRYAGGIIADIRGQGDYMDWFCSGSYNDLDEKLLGRQYVSESVVTDEIREDLKQIGWVVVDDSDQEY